MKTFDELLKILNEANIQQDEMAWEENIPEEIWEELWDRYVVLAEEIDVDKHRWYETSVTVVKIDDRFMGIDHVSNIFSETMHVSDVGYIIKFFEMVEINQPTYIKKL